MNQSLFVIQLITILLFSIAKASFVIDTFDGYIGSTSATTLNLNIGNDAEFDFYSVEFPEKCSSTTAYTLVNSTAYSTGDPPAKNQFEYYQYRTDTTTYETQYYIKDPNYDQYAAKIDYDSLEYLGATYASDSTYLQDSQHHYDATTVSYSRNQKCQYALRLTKAQDNSKGSVTYAYKQLTAFGFETEFSVQILHYSETCLSTVCKGYYGEGFAFVIQNINSNIDSESVNYGSGLGYDGLGQSLAIEFDLSQDTGKNDPTYPHVSIQYKDTTISSSNDYSLGFAYLPHHLDDGTVHNIRIVYHRQINQINFQKSTFRLTQYLSEFLDSSASSNWYSDYQIGLIQVFVDDMQIPVLSTPVNMAYCVNPDTHTSTNPVTGLVDSTMAGKAYVSITATTSAGEAQYGALQLLRWTYTEVPMCPITEVQCSVSAGDMGQTFLSLLLKNIGSEKLYIKFKYLNPTLFAVNQWFDCRQPFNIDGYYENQEIKLETSIYDSLTYGCELNILYDGTVNDVILHDFANTTWTSIANVYGTFDNSYLLVGRTICAEKASGVITLTTCV